MWTATKTSWAKESLNKSSAAGQRIFFASHAEWKTGNTYSIPLFSILLSDKKSLAASSCLFIQSFPNLWILRLFQAIPFWGYWQNRKPSPSVVCFYTWGCLYTSLLSKASRGVFYTWHRHFLSPLSNPFPSNHGFYNLWDCIKGISKACFYGDVLLFYTNKYVFRRLIYVMRFIFPYLYKNISFYPPIIYIHSIIL